MSKKYKLKPWNEVTDHHFITEECWDMLVKCPALNVDALGGVMGDSVLISPADTERTFANTFIVDKDDLIVVEVTKTPKKPTPPKEKTYTKDDVRKAGMRVVENIVSEDEAVASALAIAKLINELN